MDTLLIVGFLILFDIIGIFKLTNTLKKATDSGCA